MRGSCDPGGGVSDGGDMRNNALLQVPCFVLRVYIYAPCIRLILWFSLCVTASYLSFLTFLFVC